jgi:hypothetical protein
LIDHVDDFVSPRVDDADLVINDEITVVAVVGEEADDVDRDREETHVARDPPTNMKIETGMVHAGVLKIERTVQPLTILNAQMRARFANVLTPPSDAFASVVLVPVFFSALALLRALLLLGAALLRASGSSLLSGPPLFGRTLMALALFTLGRPLAILPLWFRPAVWLALMSGTLRAIAVLRLVPSRVTRLTARAAASWARVHALAATGWTVHAGLAASWIAAMFMALS